jgi:hypothetical protein
VAGRLAWTRADVLSWLSETRGVSSKAETSVKIKASPYPRNPARFLVTFELPTTDHRRGSQSNVRKVAPLSGSTRPGAIAVGAFASSGMCFAECMDLKRRRMITAVHTKSTSKGREGQLHDQAFTGRKIDGPHARGFLARRLFAVYLGEQAHATQCSYDSIWKNYFEPCSPRFHWTAIGKHEIALLRGKLSHMRKASGRNQVMKKLRRVFDDRRGVRADRASSRSPGSRTRRRGRRRRHRRTTIEEIGLLSSRPRSEDGPGGTRNPAADARHRSCESRRSAPCAGPTLTRKVGIITVRHNYSKGKAEQAEGGRSEARRNHAGSRRR